MRHTTALVRASPVQRTVLLRRRVIGLLQSPRGEGSRRVRRRRRERRQSLISARRFAVTGPVVVVVALRTARALRGGRPVGGVRPAVGRRRRRTSREEDRRHLAAELVRACDAQRGVGVVDARVVGEADRRLRAVLAQPRRPEPGGRDAGEEGAQVIFRGAVREVAQQQRARRRPGLARGHGCEVCRHGLSRLRSPIASHHGR
mmetsp:Transcript_822/g.3273  ORF Transcript_822/g.3273 Transcript_822/m.3273 type:complete len:203 (-) Transcript_822:2-610(-)